MTWVRSEMGRCGVVPAAALTRVFVGGTSEKNEVSGLAIQEGCTNYVLDRQFLRWPRRALPVLELSCHSLSDTSTHQADQE